MGTKKRGEPAAVRGRVLHLRGILIKYALLGKDLSRFVQVTLSAYVSRYVAAFPTYMRSVFSVGGSLF